MVRQCDQCGSDVSDRYWQVFAVDGRLHGCLHCETKTSDHMPSVTGSESRSAEA